MDKPKFFYQTCESKYPNYVAVMAQFLPTFDSGVKTTAGEETKSDAATATGSESGVTSGKIHYQDDAEEIEEADVS